MNSVASVVLIGLAAAWAPVVPHDAHARDKAPKVQIPSPGVPEIMTMQAKFVRAAYNNEGYVILGYQVSQRSVGEPWMLIDFGITLPEGVPDFTFRRNALSLQLPNGKTVPLRL
jgi:hypothetical protein